MRPEACQGTDPFRQMRQHAGKHPGESLRLGFAAGYLITLNQRLHVNVKVAWKTIMRFF
jgi:hypothetical protein